MKKLMYSQFADDTVLFVRNDESLSNVFEILKAYGKLSGLSINMEKTEGIRLGTLQHSQCTIDLPIKWNKTSMKYLGIYVGPDKAECGRLNWEEKLKQLSKNLEMWRKR
jgi:hypothetical protein